MLQLMPMIGRFTSITSSSGALMSLPSTSSSFDCSSFPLVSCVGGGSAAGRAHVAPPDIQLSQQGSVKVPAVLVFDVDIPEWKKRRAPITVNPDGRGFRCSVALECSSSSALKLHITFKKKHGSCTLPCVHCECKLQLWTSTTHQWGSLLRSLWQMEKKIQFSRQNVMPTHGLAFLTSDFIGLS